MKWGRNSAADSKGSSTFVDAGSIPVGSTISAAVGDTQHSPLRHNPPNLVIVVTGIGTRTGFSVTMADVIPDLGLLGGCQCFPLYLYEWVEAHRAA